MSPLVSYIYLKNAYFTHIKTLLFIFVNFTKELIRYVNCTKIVAKNFYKSGLKTRQSVLFKSFLLKLDYENQIIYIEQGGAS